MEAFLGYPVSTLQFYCACVPDGGDVRIPIRKLALEQSLTKNITHIHCITRLTWRIWEWGNYYCVFAV